METNVLQIEQMSKRPAVLTAGIEGIWYDDQKWVKIDGQTMRFEQAPAAIQIKFVACFRRDEYSQNYLKKHWGLIKFQEQFDQWFKCILGGLDNIPDISLNDDLVPDGYNNLCTDMSCPHRGKFCSVRTGLKNYESETIQLLAEGKTFQQAADKLCISLPGLKSRVEKIKEKLGATNEASMIARAARLGIL